MAIRIDENIDDTLSNVESAQTQLLKYLNTISSNRWLVMKIFAVLMVFLTVRAFLLFPFFQKACRFLPLCLVHDAVRCDIMTCKRRHAFQPHWMQQLGIVHVT